MGARLYVYLLLSIHAASSTTVIPLGTTGTVTVTPLSTSVSSSTFSSTPSSITSFSSTLGPSNPSNINFLSPKPSSNYEVTENVVDIPDDRPLPSIIPNFSLSKPLNIINTTNADKNVTKLDTGDENNHISRTSFTYVHFIKDEDNKKEKNKVTEEKGIKKFFKGIKDYVFHLKRGVVDGLHNYFHKEDKIDKDTRWSDKFPKRSGDDKTKNDEDYFLKEDKKDKENGWHYKSNKRSSVDKKKNDDDDDFDKYFHKSFHSDENFDDFEHDTFKHEFENY